MSIRRYGVVTRPFSLMQEKAFHPQLRLPYGEMMPP